MKGLTGAKLSSLYIHVTVLHRNRFLSNNQTDAPIIQILFCYKTLRVSGIFSAHHHEFSTVHSTLVSFVQVFYDRFQAERSILTAWKWSSKTCMKLTSAECTVGNS